MFGPPAAASTGGIGVVDAAAVVASSSSTAAVWDPFAELLAERTGAAADVQPALIAGVAADSSRAHSSSSSDGCSGIDGRKVQLGFGVSTSSSGSSAEASLDPFAASVRSNSSSMPASGSGSSRGSNSKNGPHLGCSGAVSLLPIVTASSAGGFDGSSVAQHLDALLRVSTTSGAGSSAGGVGKVGSAFGSCLDVLADSSSGSASVSGGQGVAAAAAAAGGSVAGNDGLAQLETLMVGHLLE
jgi:hypothetical protein